MASTSRRPTSSILQDYDVPGNFTAVVDQPHQQVHLESRAFPVPRETRTGGCVNAGNNGQTYTQFGGDVLNWKIQETQSYQNDVWGFDLTERWDSPASPRPTATYLVCAPGTCPAPTIQTSDHQLQQG